MKLSIYNTYLYLPNNVACIYNSRSDKTLVFRNNGKTISFNIIPDSIKDKLIDAGMLVDENLNEYVEYVNFARGIENDLSHFHLLVNPTLNCNFHCSYCYETHFRSKMSNEILRRIELLITRQSQNAKALTISFFGGEPLLYFDSIMKPPIEYAHSEAQRYNIEFACNMTSNGFLLNKNRVLWLNKHNFTNAQITLDGSKEIHNNIRFRHVGDNTYDKIVYNIKLLLSNHISVTLRLNCTKSNIDSLEKIASSFDDLPENQRENLTVDIQIIWQEENKRELLNNTDSIVSTFNEKGISASKMDFRGFCYADKRNGCLVNYNGDIYKCTARDFSQTPRDGFINEDGILIWENNSLNKRMESKFQNQPCKDCRIFPLCHGGCSTNSLELQNYCLHNFSEEEKDEVVKNRIVHNASLKTM